MTQPDPPSPEGSTPPEGSTTPDPLPVKEGSSAPGAPIASTNFAAILWHAAFLALASNFMDVDTVIPSMLIKAGGDEVLLGFLTAIMLGGSSLFQLVFASLISHRPKKKGLLLLGVNLRILALFSLAALFVYAGHLSGGLFIVLIFILISQFSFSGSFAGVSYVDILGKSLIGPTRKAFFSTKQVINSAGVFISALAARKLLVTLSFPKNYALLFALAGTLILIASLGFWRLKERRGDVSKKLSFVAFFAMIPSEIQKNANLKYYLLLINSLGLGLSIFSFIIYYAKHRFGLSYAMLGNILLLKTLGMLVAGIFLVKFSKRFRYRHLLIVGVLLATSIPIAALLLRSSPRAYPFIFVFAGIFLATFKTAISGILLEISTDENRSTYTGISGAGNILTTVFPLGAGFLIKALGYTPVFIGVSLLTATSILFVLRIDCDEA